VNTRITAKYSRLYIIVSSDSIGHNNHVTSIFVRTPGVAHCLHLLLLCSRWDTTTLTQLYVYNVNQSNLSKKNINQLIKRSQYYSIAISAKCVFFMPFAPTRRACNLKSVRARGVQFFAKNQIVRKAKPRCG